MTENSNERLIYLKDLLFVVLRGWRALICAALAFALVLGGVKAVLDLRSLDSRNAVLEAEYAQLRSEYEENLKAAEEDFQEAEEKAEEYRSYVKKSVYMQLDPEAFYEMELVLFVNAAEEYEQYQKIFNREYCYALDDEDVVDRLAKQLDIKPSHMRELYTVEQNGEDGTIQLTGIGADEKTVQRMLREVEKIVDEVTVAVTEKIGEHSIIILQESVEKQKDSGVAETQRVIKDKLRELEELEKKAKEAKDALTAPVARHLSMADVVRSAVLYAVIGALAGCVFAVAYLWIRHIFGYKVYSASILNAVTKVRILGCLATGPVKNPVDRLLMKLEGRDVTEPEVRAKLLAADIRNRCGDISGLLVTGDAEASSRKLLVDALQNAMQGIQVEDNGSLFGSVSAVESLAKCDAVVFVEQCECSLYANVEKEAEMVADYGKKLIGCVLLDG